MPEQTLTLLTGRLVLPVFLPDATLGVVRTLDADDLRRVGVGALVMNTFHLMQRPGSSIIQALGGLHRMSAWDAPIITDSGGFQAYSLIRQNAKYGSIGERGITILPEGGGRKLQLTPEKSVQLQVSYGADVVICLDDCTHVDATRQEQENSVRRTLAWAKRSRAEFDRLMEQKKLEGMARPKLFGVIQGGGYPDLRRACAEGLLEIGFDGYGYGGWPLDAHNTLLTEIIGLTRALVPRHLPMHALGVGHPANVAACYRMGYDLFDSAMPTRDARHGRLYVFNSGAGLAGEEWFSYLYIGDKKHIRSGKPISEFCDCPTCTQYSLGYLHHLFKAGDALIQRLMTLHNLRFMVQLTQRLRELAHA